MTHHSACQVLRYLKGNPGRGLFFPRNCSLQIFGFFDADCARCLDSRRSISDYCFFIGTSLVSWRAKKQQTISRSSSEAEYRTLSPTTCELQWILYLLTDLHITCSRPPVLYCDNQGALHIAANLVFHECIKHLERDCHQVREKLQSGLGRLLPISSKGQLADFFTKALQPQAFLSFISKLNMLDIYHGLACGGMSNSSLSGLASQSGLSGTAQRPPSSALIIGLKIIHTTTNGILLCFQDSNNVLQHNFPCHKPSFLKYKQNTLYLSLFI